MPCAWPVTDDMKNPAHYPLAVDKARYAGDGVAVVLATSDAIARDAIDAIDVQYEPLEAVIDLEDALSDRVVIHDDLGTNTSLHVGRSRSRTTRAPSTRRFAARRVHRSASATSSSA